MLFSDKLLDSIKGVPCQINAGKYTVKLAENERELLQTQELRARIFFKHLPREKRISAEKRDRFAHHLIVIHHAPEGDKVVGTLRLLNSDFLPQEEKFYSQEYYHFDALLKSHKRSVELSRFCIEEPYRKGSILLLIWRSALLYLEHMKVDLMFGISSFPGVDPTKHAPVLQFLYRYHLADQGYMPSTIQGAFPIKALESEDVAKERDLPTLIRGYLKMGGKISDHYYVDPHYNTTFVFLYVELKTFNQYLQNKRH